MRRMLLLVPLAAGLLHCGNNAVKPQPGVTAGTNAGNGSNSTGAGSSGSTRGTGSSGSSATIAGSTTSAGSTGSTTAAGSTGTTTAAGSTGSTSAAGATGSTSAAGSTGAAAGSTGSTGIAAGSTGSAGSIGSTGTSGSTGGSTGSSDGFIRIANLVPTRGSFDFCLTDSGGSPIGPVIGSYGVGGTNGLTFGDVSLYIPLPGSATGITYAITVVTGGSTSCTPPLFAPPGATVNVVTAQYETVIAEGLVGSVAAPLTYTEYLDRTAGSATETLVRFFNASPDTNHPSVDFGKVAANGALASAIFSNVAYGGSSIGQAGTGPRGYLAMGPVTGQDFGVRNHSGNPRPVFATTANPLNLPANTASSFFLIGDSTLGGFGLQLLYCPDDGALAVTGTAVLASCQ